MFCFAVTVIYLTVTSETLSIGQEFTLSSLLFPKFLPNSSSLPVRYWFFYAQFPAPHTNADAPSLIQHRFVICYAYYSIAAATEHGNIMFLANYENPEWITDFEEAYFFDTKEKAEQVVATLQQNFKANNFPKDSVSIIVVNWSESD